MSWTTLYTGSLPRPDDLIQMMWAKGDGIPVDEQALAERVAAAVQETVDKQVAAGISIVNDGEMSKPSYATYVKDRLSGFGGESPESYFFADLEAYPRSAELVAANPGRRKRSAPACNAPIDVQDAKAAALDMVNLRKSAEQAEGMFSSAASPGVVSLFFGNEYYATDEEYVFAIAEAMRHEYEAIAAAGATVQLDCPDLAMGRAFEIRVVRAPATHSEASSIAQASQDDPPKRSDMPSSIFESLVTFVTVEGRRLVVCPLAT